MIIGELSDNVDETIGTNLFQAIGRNGYYSLPNLFSYGTLRQKGVQLENYGRELRGEADTLVGYRLEPLAISDPEVVRISGKSVHPIARASGDQADRVVGIVFQISEAELTATDAYEVDVYGRVKVTLESGRTAWVYVGPPLDRRL